MLIDTSGPPVSAQSPLAVAKSPGPTSLGLTGSGQAAMTPVATVFRDLVTGVSTDQEITTPEGDTSRETPLQKEGAAATKADDGVDPASKTPVSDFSAQNPSVPEDGTLPDPSNTKATAEPVAPRASAERASPTLTVPSDAPSTKVQATSVPSPETGPADVDETGDVKRADKDGGFARNSAVAFMESVQTQRPDGERHAAPIPPHPSDLLVEGQRNGLHGTQAFGVIAPMLAEEGAAGSRPVPPVASMTVSPVGGGSSNLGVVQPSVHVNTWQVPQPAGGAPGLATAPLSEGRLASEAASSAFSPKPEASPATGPVAQKPQNTAQPTLARTETTALAQTLSASSKLPSNQPEVPRLASVPGTVSDALQNPAVTVEPDPVQKVFVAPTADKNAQPTASVASPVMGLSRDLVTTSVEDTLPLVGEALDLKGSVVRQPSEFLAPGPKSDLQVGRNVIAQVREVMISNTQSVTEIQLTPEDLGRIRLSFTGPELTGHVSVQVERPETLDLLRRNLDLLRSELSSEGFTNLEFSLSGEGSTDLAQTVPNADPQGENAAAEADLETNPNGASATRSIYSVSSDGRIDIKL